MDTVINRLSEIETAARAIVEEANARKKAFAEEMDAKTAAFDKSVDCLLYTSDAADEL